MKSLTDSPLGWLRSNTSLCEPSGLGTAPRGDIWLVGNGGSGKGPAVWPRCTSLLMAFVTTSALSLADLLLRRKMGFKTPLKPISKPARRPVRTYLTNPWSGCLVKNVSKLNVLTYWLIDPLGRGLYNLGDEICGGHVQNNCTFLDW